MNEKNLTILSYVLALALGVCGTVTYNAVAQRADDRSRIKELESVVRAATTKYIEQGERFQDQIDNARSEGFVEGTAFGKSEANAITKDKP